jgi:glycosyltransferase involved in cell wall biosynthesis
MKVVVAVAARFVGTPDGAVWTQDGHAYRFFTRYLSAFDEVRVLARVAGVSSPADHVHRVDGPGVTVVPIPYYLGPRQYLQRRWAVVRAVRATSDDAEMAILRVPSTIGSLFAAARDRANLPYALEVMADPYDVFAPGVVQHPLRPLLRWQETRSLRRQCRSAVAVSYVTARYLQRRYPIGPAGIETNYSSVDLPAAAYRAEPSPVTRSGGEFTLVSVGSLEQMYKGIDTLIMALAALVTDRLPVRLVHIGDGRYRPRLEALAARLKVTERVHFAGTVAAGADVRRQLDAADLFVMPSRTEGLPKALLEAMARGLPAIGTTVGGIPELLPPEDLVVPDDMAGLAALIRQFLASPERRAAAGTRNLLRSRDFSDEVLSQRRTAFYRALRDLPAPSSNLSSVRRAWQADTVGHE